MKENADEQQTQSHEGDNNNSVDNNNDGDMDNSGSVSPLTEMGVDELINYIKELRSENKSKRLKAKEIEDKLNALQLEHKNREEKALEEQGKYEELYNKQKSEFEELNEEYQALKLFKQEHDERLEAERKEALKRLPEETQEIFKDANIDMIEAQLKLWEKANGGDTAQGKPRESGQRRESYNSYLPKNQNVKRMQEYRKILGNN